MESRARPRRPLGPRDVNKPTEGRKVNTYGKRGGRAAERAVFKDVLFEEEVVKPAIRQGSALPRTCWLPDLSKSQPTTPASDLEPNEVDLMRSTTTHLKDLKVTGDEKRSVRQSREITSPAKVAEQSNHEVVHETPPSIRRSMIKHLFSRRARASLELKDTAEQTDYVQPLLDLSHKKKAIGSFETWALQVSKDFTITKKGGGSFAEVFGITPRLNPSVSSKSKVKCSPDLLQTIGGTVFKLVPIRAQVGDGSRSFTPVDELADEIKIFQAVDGVPGHPQFREVTILSGRMPQVFMQAWKEYQKGKKREEKVSKFKKAELWAVLEMDDAGVELGERPMQSIYQVIDIFWGVAMALAAAEKSNRFEHRDLHMSNICIKSNRKDGLLLAHPSHPITSDESNTSSGCGYSGIKVTLIDYTFARADLDSNHNIAYLNLAKHDWAFKSKSEESEAKLQFDTYRLMGREVAAASNATKALHADWSRFVPRTNVIWLRYVLEILMKHRLRGKLFPNGDIFSTQLQLRLIAQMKEVLKALEKETFAGAVEVVEWAEERGYLKGYE